MIINEQSKDLEILGEHSSKKATISADKMAKLQYLLTKGLYKDPVTAVIAEWTNNGVDSVVQAGKDPMENPVIVSIGYHANGQAFFRVEDKGTGLDKSDFENICMNYLESTKENDNNSIGHFGIGMKSFLSLDRSATFTCRKNGKEVVYLVYEGGEFVNYDILSEKDTVEGDGVIAELAIDRYKEYNNFVSKATQKLAYYDTAILIVDNRPIKNTIFRNDLFQWSSNNKNSQMHLCLKDVYYSIDWEALEIPHISFPVALRFNLDSGITPTPSRESYITNEATKKLILDRIKDVADWFVNRYNSEQKPYETFLEAYKNIDSTTYMVKIENTDFTINNLLGFTQIPVKQLEIKGISLLKPVFYKGIYDSFFWEYDKVGYKQWNKFKQKRIYHSPGSQILTNRKVIKVGSNFKGNVKEFLGDKYGNDILYIRFREPRIYGGPKNNQGYNCYYSILDMYRHPRSTRRDIIKEYQYIQKQVLGKLIDETGVEDSQEYIDWLKKKREDAIEKRKLSRVNGTYQGINKQVGDVTLAYSYIAKIGFPFKKKAYPIKDLPSFRFLTVYFTEVTDDVIRVIKAMRVQKTVQFALVGKKEANKIPNCKQFVKFEDFMARDYKPFMRMASAILFKQVLEEFSEITGYGNSVLEHCLVQVHEDRRKLKVYCDANVSNVSHDVEQAIIAIAEEKDLFDKYLWDSYLRVKEATKKYSFLSCLRKPDYWDVEGLKKYNRLIGQLLLFRRLYHKDIPEDVEIIIQRKEKKEEEEESLGESEELKLLEEELETA